MKRSQDTWAQSIGSNSSIRRCVDIISSGKSIFLGGSRSGKSKLAESSIAAISRRRCYVATAPTSWIENDEDFRSRVALHRSRRSEGWDLIELDQPSSLYEVISDATHPLVVDSVGTWIASNHDFVPDLAKLGDALGKCKVPISFVAEEVGSGINPIDGLSRRFVDLVGTVNQFIASSVDHVYYVAAGFVVELAPPQFGSVGQ